MASITIDSSALGMLLLLREKAMEKKYQMKLPQSKDSVRQVLEVANFGRYSASLETVSRFDVT